MKITLITLDGIIIDDTLYVKLGMSENDLTTVLGAPDSADDTQRYYDKYDIRIDFLSGEDKIEFIEILSDEIVDVEIFGVNPLKTDANQLLSFLNANNAGDYSIEGNGIEYYYKNLSIGLCRVSTPKDIYEMIEESKEDNTYQKMKEELEHDLEKSKYFTTIGLE